MQISIINTQSDLKIPVRLIKRIVRSVISHEGRSCDEVAIHFITNEEMCALHAQFFDDPSPTDCISFPMDSDNAHGYCMLGEVFVCPAVAVSYAKKHNIVPFQELTLYIVHGLLHLMGYDDIEVGDRLAMRRAEKRHLKNLEVVSRQ